jgi:hypothetical protein
MEPDNIPWRYRELAHRENDGLEVMLFWQTLTDELTITVSDERSGAYSNSAPLRTRPSTSSTIRTRTPHSAAWQTDKWASHR